MVTNEKTLEENLIFTLNNIANDNFTLLNLNEVDYSLFSGLSGNLLFYYNLYLVSRNETHLNYVKYFLDLCLKKIENDKHIEYSFCGGVSGFFWVLNYIKQQNLIEIEDFDSLLDHIDFNVNMIIANKLKRFDYDPFYGLLGYANYLLERKTPKANETLSIIVDILWDNKQSINNGYTWFDKNNEFNDSNSIKFNLGLAHGIPSIIMVLSIIYKKGINTAKCHEMIIKSMFWLESISIKFKNTNESQFMFPSSIKEDGIFYGMGRLSWCYSDLGISTLFNNVGLNLNNEEYLQKGHLLTNNLIRIVNKIQISSTVDDAGLCHGAYGNAHIFYKLFKAFNDKELLKISRSFLELGISMKVNKSGFGGYQSLQYDHKTNKKYLHNDIGVLTGSSGIGLVILSYLYPEIEPTWDRCLLLS